MSLEEKDHPATQQHAAPQYSSLCGKDWKEQLGTSCPSTLHFGFGPFRPACVWFCKWSDARPAVCDQWHCPRCCLSLFLNFQNGVLPQGDLHTSRMVAEMHLSWFRFYREMKTVPMHRYNRHGTFIFIFQFARDSQYSPCTSSKQLIFFLILTSCCMFVCCQHYSIESTHCSSKLWLLPLSEWHIIVFDD